MYEELKQALFDSGIPFAEVGWQNAPQIGSYGIIALDAQSAALWADGQMQEQGMQGTIDLYARSLGVNEMQTIQRILKAQGVSWELNDISYEPARHIRHYEWVFDLEAV